MVNAGELRQLEKGGSGPLPPAGHPSPGIPSSFHDPEVPSATTSAQATKGSADTRNPELFSMEDAEATVETLLLMEFADLGTLDQTVTCGKLRGNLVRALSRFVLLHGAPPGASTTCSVRTISSAEALGNSREPQRSLLCHAFEAEPASGKVTCQDVPLSSARPTGRCSCGDDSDDDGDE